MIAAVADTHTAVWYIFADSRLSARAHAFIEQVAQRGERVGVSAITLIEIVYLIEKGRLASDVITRLTTTLDDPDKVLVEVPLDSSIVIAVRQVPRKDVPDMPDRIVAGTALHFGVPVISRDGKIKAARLQSIW